MYFILSYKEVTAQGFCSILHCWCSVMLLTFPYLLSKSGKYIKHYLATFGSIGINKYMILNFEALKVENQVLNLLIWKNIHWVVFLISENIPSLQRIGDGKEYLERRQQKQALDLSELTHCSILKPA